MEPKKSEKADLQNYSGLFFQVGLFLTLIGIYFVMETKFYEKTYKDLGSLDVDVEDEIIPITEREQKKPPPPPPPPVVQEIIRVVEDDVDLEEELDIESTETDQEEAIEIEEVVEEEEEEVFSFAVVEDKPIFPGCESVPKAQRDRCFQQRIVKHIQKTFRYPEVAREMGIQGKVYVSFVISKSGKISDVKVMRKVDKSLDKEAHRIVSKIPSMTPAKQRGKAVKVSYMVPITFRLQ